MAANRAWRAPARPLLRPMSPAMAPHRIARGSSTIVFGTARPRSAGEATTTSSETLSSIAIEADEFAAALPPAPVRSSSADHSTTTRQQRPGSAPPAPSLERAPRAEVAAGIRRNQPHRRTASPLLPSVDRALAASAPLEEANSSLWSSPDELFQRSTARSDFFPVGWVERGTGAGAGGEELPPAPVRSEASTSTSSSSSSSSRSRLLFPELNGHRLLVIERKGDAPPLLIPVTKGATTAAAALLGAGLLLVAAAAAAVRRRRVRGRRSAASGDEVADADALLKLRGEAAAARLRSRFAGALDGGDQSGGGSLGGDDESDQDEENGDESDKTEQKRNREAERAFRSFFSKSRMHLVDEDAWFRDKGRE